MDCLFCKIAAGEIPAQIIYQDDQVLAFDDIHPQAPQHKLVIPRKHIATLNDVEEAEVALVGHMVLTARRLANQFEFATSGYRLAWNVNLAGGQTVYHIHLHLLGGRDMKWPPG